MPDADSPASDHTDDRYVLFSEDLEKPRPDEAESIRRIAEVLHRNNSRSYRRYGHAIRDAHAKSHGILRGELQVLPDLAEHLRQGIFAQPRTYPIIARLSTTAGVIRSDQVRGARGLGIKVIGVDGPRLDPDDTANTQDFVFVNNPEFPFADARDYSRLGMVFAFTLARTPDRVMNAASAALRAAQPILHRFGRSLPNRLTLFAAPNTNTLGETFYTVAPIRYGKYVAKLRVAPLSDSVTVLKGVTVAGGNDAHTESIVNFFRTASAEYEISAQLCTDIERMPIENAKARWSTEESPFVPIATISYPVQDPYSTQRKYFGDEVLAFNSWRAIVDHRPLGSINRLKKLVYDASRDFRHEKNHVSPLEPSSTAQLPD